MTGIPPSYEQTSFAEADKRDRLRLVASPDGRDSSVTIHADAHVCGACSAVQPRPACRQPQTTRLCTCGQGAITASSQRQVAAMPWPWPEAG